MQLHTPEEIENSKIELAESLKRLYKNRDFKKIILEGFLENGSTFLTKNMTKVKPEYEADIMNELKARSIAWKYLDGIEADAKDILDARAM